MTNPDGTERCDRGRLRLAHHEAVPPSPERQVSRAFIARRAQHRPTVDSSHGLG